MRAQQKRHLARSRWLPLGAALVALSLSGGAAAQAPRQAPSAFIAANAEAEASSNEVAHLVEAERFAEALPLAEKAVAQAEKAVALGKGRLPAKHTLATPSPEELLARVLDQLGHTLLELGELSRAEPAFSRSRDIYRRILGPGSEDYIAWNLAGRARLAALRGDGAAADRLWSEVSGHFDVYANRYAARCYSEIGRLYLLKGDFARAEPLLTGAVTGVRARVSDKADILRHLAELHLGRGRGEDAEPLLQEALEVASAEASITGVPSPRLARTLDTLGRLSLEAGSPERAAKAFTRALEIQQKALGSEHPALAVSLDGQAQAALHSGDPGRAEPLLVRALAIREKTLGAAHPETAMARLHLGDVRRLHGAAGSAAELYERAHTTLEQALGGQHPAVAEALLRRAELARRGGDLALAETLCQKALAILEGAFGAEHPRLAEALDALGETHLRAGRIGPATRTLGRSAELRDRRAATLLALGSEEQKLAAVAALRGQSDLLLALPFTASPPEPGAVDLALTAVLRRKGRVLDALSMGRAALRDRRSPEDAALLRALLAVQSRIVDLIVGGPGAVPLAEHQSALAELERQKQRLEVELAKRSARLVTGDPPPALADLDAALPPDAALVELFVRRPPGALAPRVAAFVRRRRGATGHVDLGEARVIDGLVKELRAALSDPRRDPTAAARALDEKTMRPVRALLGGERRLLISPDGQLNLIPFGALRDEDGRYLLERFSFTYLSSGRDLLRFQHDETPAEPGIPALLVGAPEFGAADKKRSRYRAEVSAGAFEIGDVRFPPLTGSAVETRAIAAVIPGASVLTGAQASEEAVKKAAHPQLLHLATHGFFLPEETSAAGLALANPLLRAGLALATANQPAPGREDGILTALELSGLDLYGTKLVVLSACDTGIGEARAGDGVHGLRRAVVMAGAQTLVMSLWKISDRDTRDLMVDYHRRLRQGGGRSEALREAALALREVPGNSHPFYWASFIVSGDGSSLDGKDVAPRPPQLGRVEPGARGCGCALAEDGGEGSLVSALAALALLRLRRRRLGAGTEVAGACCAKH